MHKSRVIQYNNCPSCNQWRPWWPENAIQPGTCFTQIWIPPTSELLMQSHAPNTVQQLSAPAGQPVILCQPMMIPPKQAPPVSVSPACVPQNGVAPTCRTNAPKTDQQFLASPWEPVKLFRPTMILTKQQPTAVISPPSVPQNDVTPTYRTNDAQKTEQQSIASPGEPVTCRPTIITPKQQPPASISSSCVPQAGVAPTCRNNGAPKTKPQFLASPWQPVMLYHPMMMPTKQQPPTAVIPPCFPQNDVTPTCQTNDVPKAEQQNVASTCPFKTMGLPMANTAKKQTSSCVTPVVVPPTCVPPTDVSSKSYKCEAPKTKQQNTVPLRPHSVGCLHSVRCRFNHTYKKNHDTCVNPTSVPPKCVPPTGELQKGQTNDTPKTQQQKDVSPCPLAALCQSTKTLPQQQPQICTATECVPPTGRFPHCPTSNAPETQQKNDVLFTTTSESAKASMERKLCHWELPPAGIPSVVCKSFPAPPLDSHATTNLPHACTCTPRDNKYKYTRLRRENPALD